MELAFDSIQLRTLCENEEVAQLELGEPISGALKRRLADLRAVKSIFDLPSVQPRQMAGDDGATMEMDLHGTYKIIFRANHPKVTGTIDWHHVSRIKILSVEGDHA